MSEIAKYIFFNSSVNSRYALNYTNSDPYDDDSVKSYDRMLHRTLSAIFLEHGLTSDRYEAMRRGAKTRTNKNFIFELILEREPAFGELFKKTDNVIPLLWIAVLRCYQESAELLVRSGADINELCGYKIDYKLDKKWTLLHALPAMYPSLWNERFCALLIEYDADLKARDSGGRTVLHAAIADGRVEVAKMIIEKEESLLTRNKADAAARDRSGYNALHHLTWLPGNHADLARVLIEKGASLDDKAGYIKQYQPIHLAVQRGRIELVNLFLDHGVNVDARGSKNKFPLYIAARKCDDPAMLLTLLKRGANIDLKDIRGKTALHGLISDENICEGHKNHVEKLKLLLSVGADMFATDQKGQTPFDVIYDENDFHEEFDYVPILLKVLALRKACQQPSIEFKDERIVGEKYPELRNRYQDCVEEINRIKATKFIKSGAFFELLTKCQCQVLPIMRNAEFTDKFSCYDFSAFTMYAEDILEAFERATLYYQSVLDQENLIDEAIYNVLPHMIVRKVARFAVNCEICELKKIVQASRDK